MRFLLVVSLLLAGVACYAQQGEADSLPAITPLQVAVAECDIDSTRKFTVDVVNDSLQHVYYAPRWYEAVTNIPANFADAGRIVASRKVIKPLIIVAGSTAVLYAADEWIIDGVQSFSRKLGISTERGYTSLLPRGPSFLNIPTNLNSALIYMGEGSTSMLIFSGIAIHGLITNNHKEVRMLTQAISGYIAMQLTVKTIKFCVGRELPVFATRDRGAFNPFPPLSKYENYAAFPSGHVATMMFTTTLLAQSYPNSQLIKPIGYTLTAACALALINENVHWASDYPLAIALGYVFGKVAANRGRLAIHAKQSSLMGRLDVSPTILFNGTMGVSLLVDMSPSAMLSR